MNKNKTRDERTEMISIIVPVYKVEAYLRQCLESLINQTYQNLEIILVDDGSPDNCGAICDEYAKRDNRICVIHKENAGMNAARNDGIAHSHGDWLAFVDSDDWCDSNYYKDLLSVCGEERPDIILAGGRIAEYDPGNKTVRYFTKAFRYTGRQEIEVMGANIAIYGNPWDKLYRAEFVKENHLQFDINCKVFEDIWFNYQAFSCALSIQGCTWIGYHVRVRQSGNMKSYNPDRIYQAYDTVSKMRNYAIQHDLSCGEKHAVEIVSLLAVSNSMIAYYFHPDNKKSRKVINEEIRKIKKMPLIREAILSKDNQNISKRHFILKYLLRLPFIWPVRMLYFVRRFVKSN